MKNPADIYQKALEGSLTDAERTQLQQDLGLEDSAMSTWLNQQPLQQTEQDLARALTNTAPREQRLQPLSSSEANALFDSIMEQTQPDTVQPEPVRPEPVRPEPVQPEQATTSWFRQFWRPNFALGLVLGAAAAGLVLSLAIPQPVAETTREKGAAVAVPRIRLMFNVAHREQGRPLVIERGTPGARYDVQADILLHYTIDAPGYVCLAHRAPQGHFDILAQPAEQQSPGWQEFRIDGKIQAIELASLTGRNTFFAVWSPSPVACEKQLQSVVQQQHVSHILLDSFFIEVNP